MLILLKTGEAAKVMAFSENLAIYTDVGLALKASTLGRYLWMVFAIPFHVPTLVEKSVVSLELISKKVKQNYSGAAVGAEKKAGFKKLSFVLC